MSNQDTHSDEDKFTNFQEFNEFHISDYTDFNDTHLSTEDIPVFNDHELSFKESDFDSEYRSIAAVSNVNPLGFNLATRDTPPVAKGSTLPGGTVFDATLHARQEAPKATIAAPKIEVMTGTSTASAAGSAGKKAASRPIVAPAEPFYIAPSTHFTTKLNVGDIKARVEVELNSKPEVSYEFLSGKCRWEGVYLVGSTRCKFEINVYKRTTGGYVVEGNRLSGDSFAFIGIYKTIRKIFDPSSDSRMGPTLRPLTSKNPVDPAATLTSVEAVLAMATSGVGEAQVGAAQILCNLTSDECMHAILLSNGCVEVLVSLLKVEFDSCNQYAVCALASLSTSRSCQEVLIQNESFLQSLLLLCTDGNYNTIEMRRECTRLLANISCLGGQVSAQQVVACAGAENIASWLSSVDSLKDDRLRAHADRAKVSLAACT